MYHFHSMAAGLRSRVLLPPGLAYHGGRLRMHYPLQTLQLRLVQKIHVHENLKISMNRCTYECKHAYIEVLSMNGSHVHIAQGHGKSMFVSMHHISMYYICMYVNE